VYTSERKCKANAEETEAVLCAMASDFRVVENVSVSVDNMDNTRPDNASLVTNSVNILCRVFKLQEGTDPLTKCHQVSSILCKLC
jgi:hypothetical protein